jgi:monofunctional glycosyltransferase
VARFSGWRIFRTAVRWVLVLVLAFYALCLGGLAAMRWVNPPTTAVQTERRIDAWWHHKPYRKRQTFVPLGRISPELQHAVISAEDGRFYQHHGIDWEEVQKVVDQDREEGKLGRGGSTITQQLVKNLFLTTNRSLVRKGVEFTLTYAAEWILPKRRILELYLNEIEWGPTGVYGAEAAAVTWYNVPASKINRDQGAKMAAILPAPLRWKPEHMTAYSTEILRRMDQVGW